MEENKINKLVKNGLFIGFILLLFIPIIQQKKKFIELEPLNGSFEVAAYPTFSIREWFDGSYQTKKQLYLEQNFGFRNLFVRFYNQAYFSLYQQPRANGVVLGKDEYLYEGNYIKAYLGTDFIGEATINENVRKIEKVKNVLAKKGIQLVLVFAPGKASFYPEYILDSYHPKQRSKTNYETYKKALNKTTIHFLDFHQWFRSMKTTSPYPLFPKTGIHWSKYGELLAADSLVNYLNSIVLNKSLPTIKITGIKRSSKMEDTDDDIEKGLNLLYNIQDLTMGYPTFEILKDSLSNPAKVLTIADSYYWGMFNWGCSRDVFNDGQFWYYNKQIYPDSYTKPIEVKDINLVKEVEKNDVVVVLATDANLYQFGFGFFDQMYERLKN